MNKTKMIATIGPSSKSKDVIREIIKEGVDVIRINMSHSTFEEAKEVILNIREINRELSNVTGIMIDTRGPEIRINDLEERKVKLEQGKNIRIVKSKIKGNSDMISITLPEALDYIRIGQHILLNDGSVNLEVVSKSSDALICEIKNDGFIKGKCSVNIPNADFDLKFLSDYDRETIKFAVLMQVDYLALSHVNNELDILDINDLLIELDDGHLQIISKIENKNAIESIDAILKVSDGVMIARGDLGVEMEIEKIPSIQKKIANLAKENGKICIIATEMLSSMQDNPRPTRAEVSDVANSVLDGTDAIMLSSETAIGKYPIETVKTTNKIIDEIEKEIDYNDLLLEFSRQDKLSIEDAICYSVVDSANRVKASSIVCATISGKTAKTISHFRPSSSVIAISPDEKTVSGLTINYGIIPIKVPMMDTTDEIIDVSIKTAKQILNLKEKDKIVIAGTFPNKEVDYTNFMKIEEIK
ncbi:MAG: pyruvate kinase [Bacilli bacterium]|nr:pyruvate kinase [Bacilli bacterium]